MANVSESHDVSRKAPEYVILGGAAAQSYMTIGVMKVLEDSNLKSGIKGYTGSSGGTIFALAASIGYSSEEMMKHTKRWLSFKLLIPYSLRSTSRLDRIRRNKGLFAGDRVKHWVGQLIQAKTLIPHATFQQLEEFKEAAAYFKDIPPEEWKSAEHAVMYKYFNNIFEKTKHKHRKRYGIENPEQLIQNGLQFVDFKATAAEIVKGKHGEEYVPEIFGAQETPDVRIEDAIAAAAALPFFFQRQRINGKMYTDTVLSTAVPIEAFAEANEENTLYFTSVHPTVEQDALSNLEKDLESVIHSYSKEIGPRVAAQLFGKRAMLSVLKATNTRRMIDEERHKSIIVPVCQMNEILSSFLNGTRALGHIINKAEQETRKGLTNMGIIQETPQVGVVREQHRSSGMRL